MWYLNYLLFPIVLCFLVAFPKISFCAPWGFQDDDSDLKNYLESLLMTRLLERAEFVEAIEDLIPPETNTFRGRMKKNYARPAIRVG
nr:conserved hypothetical protein [Hymenolepis microstoma]